MDKEQIAKRWNSAGARKNFREIRQKAGVSLEYVARLADLSQSMVSKYELGHRDLSFEALAKLHHAVQGILKDIDRKNAERVLMEKATSREMKLLLGTHVPLSSLIDGGEHERKMREGREKMEREYGPHWREVFTVLLEKADLEKRLDELRDILGLKTEAGVKDSEAEEKLETIKARDSAEEEE